MNTCAVCERPKAKPPFEVCWTCASQSRQEREKNKINPDFREWLLDRDDHRCVECGSTDQLEVDHVVPILYGGKTTPDNLQVLCHDCNEMKLADPLHLAGQAHRLAERPIVIWRPFVDELGLIPAMLISEAIGRPGYHRFGGEFHIRDWSTRLGVPVEDILFHLEWMQENNLIRFDIEVGRLWIEVRADLITGEDHRSTTSSTRRQGSGPEPDSTGRQLAEEMF